MVAKKPLRYIFHSSALGMYLFSKLLRKHTLIIYIGNFKEVEKSLSKMNYYDYVDEHIGIYSYEITSGCIYLNNQSHEN